MEVLVGMFAVTAVLIAAMLLIVSRRSRSRSTLDPSRDLHQGFPDDKNPSSVGGHLVDTPGSNF
ncbi:hypothetical protein ACFQY4_40360 [Catellatospora bangladeshensis]|nr:hypothetical protein [Catellatospora bangladeshensis]